MCGFSGFCSLSSHRQLPDNTSSLLEKMTQRLTHRGPDDNGEWVSKKHNVALAHNRLSIIDVSSAGHQPMIDTDESVVISFNGEIYNHLELRATLENLGHHYTSHSDTQTLLYAYKQWGISCLDKLDGMFAGIIFNIKKNELYIFRDRIGIKPAYFSLQNDMLSFASEIKALWDLPWNKKTISQQGLYHYLTFMVTPAPYTMFEQVYKLPAGFYMKIDAKRTISFHEWYTPLKQITKHEQKLFNQESFCLENIEQQLKQAAKKRLMSDVPFGAFLSGGVDSSLNVALMAEIVGKVKTFTVAFSDGPESNELHWARLVAKHFDTDHHELVINEQDAFNFYKKMVYHLDEPLADCVCIPFYHVAKLARDSGVTVVQVGEGADELFFGYNTYAKQKKFYDRIWHPTQRILPGFIRKTMGFMAKKFLHKKFHHHEMIDNWAYNRELFWGGAIAFNETQKKKIILEKSLEQQMSDPIIEKIYKGLNQNFDSFSIVDYHVSQLKRFNKHATFAHNMLYLELKQRLPELLLMRADKMAMATSIEARVPFLDHKLVEFMLHIPMHLKFKNNVTKYLLKKIARCILPDAVIDRKKVGFAAPTTRWFASGKHFPNYFKNMSNNSKIFNPATKQLDTLFTEATASLAVKNWVLQNFWSL